jgi:hypothetical protein
LNYDGLLGGLVHIGLVPIGLVHYPRGKRKKEKDTNKKMTMNWTICWFGGPSRLTNLEVGNDQNSTWCSVCDNGRDWVWGFFQIKKLLLQ